ARMMGAACDELGQLDGAHAAEPREVDDAGQGVEHLGGADVVRGLLAADVLLARLEGEHESAPAVDVARLPGDPPGHAPDVLGRGGEEPERGAAEVESVAEGLALPHRDVGAAVPG